jgi:hypothetical protein
MKLEDRTVIVGGYIAGRGYAGPRRYQHHRCEAHG